MDAGTYFGTAGGRVDLKEWPEAGRLRVGKRSLMRLYSGPNDISVQVFADEAHDCVGVQLHVGAPTWSADYELSKNLHRLASSRAGEVGADLYRGSAPRANTFAPVRRRLRNVDVGGEYTPTCVSGQARSNADNADAAVASAQAQRGQTGNCFRPTQIGSDCEFQN